MNLKFLLDELQEIGVDTENEQMLKKLGVIYTMFCNCTRFRCLGGWTAEELFYMDSSETEIMLGPGFRKILKDKGIGEEKLRELFGGRNVNISE